MKVVLSNCEYDPFPIKMVFIAARKIYGSLLVGLIIGLNLSILIINLGVVNASCTVYWLSLMIKV